MTTYKNDPRRIMTKYTGKCARCQDEIKKGTLAYFWPDSKTILCPVCGLPDYTSFLEAAQDEETLNLIINNRNHDNTKTN